INSSVFAIDSENRRLFYEYHVNGADRIHSFDLDNHKRALFQIGDGKLPFIGNVNVLPDRRLIRQNVGTNTLVISDEWGRDRQEVTLSSSPTLPSPSNIYFWKDVLSFEFDRGELRLIAIGVQGSGKSTTCNRILGKDVFKTTNLGADSSKSEGKYRNRYGQHIYLVETPGLSNTEDYNEDDYFKEIERALELADQRPHAFVCVFALGQSPFEITTMLKCLGDRLGDDVFKYMIFVFTSSEKLEEGKKIHDIIHPKLKLFFNKCDERHVRFSKDPDDKTKEEEVKDLLHKVYTMTQKNTPKYYTSERRS
ncbi:GTPase IMAP family member 7-like, partial [Gigantopelta aegis]|uniref:GTPase IMAP family member 7-like n=1 Tax=Gigantopelta aegis TaxID=1735272 RepID=UPI001B88CD9C